RVQPVMRFVGSQLCGLLPVTAELDSATVPPELKMPPPWAAELPVTWVFFSVTAPPARGIGPGKGTPLAIPPPSPPALLLFTRLLLRVRMPVSTAPGGP